MRKTIMAIMVFITIVLCIKSSAKASERSFDDEKILDVELDGNIQQEIFDICKENSIDFCLVMAIIEKESNFDASCISKSKDYGLMQINVVNHKRLSKKTGTTDFLDPIQNVKAGVYMLTDLFDRYEDASMVLMAYNMGEGRAKKLWKRDVYTTEYTEEVFCIQQSFYDELGW